MMASSCRDNNKKGPEMKSSYFIGRHDEREKLKTFLCESDLPLIQIYGLPYVGKTQLVKTALQEISLEISPQPLHWDYFCISNDTEWSTIHESLNKFLSSSKAPPPHIYVLDDFHKLRPSAWPSFQHICDTVFIRFPSIRIVLVISGWKAFTIKGIAYEKFKLQPLSLAESTSLFCRRSGLPISEETEACVNYLVESCNSLPGLLVRLADRLEDLLKMMSLEHICHCLNTADNFYDCLTSSMPLSRDAAVFDCFEEYITNLPPTQQRALSILSCFDGHFGVDVATKMIETDRQSTFYNLVSLVEQKVMTSDVDFKMFRIQRIARDFADQRLKHLRCNDVIKLKYINIIGEALVKAEDIYSRGLLTEAIGIINENWENIESLMRQGVHHSSDENIFPAYYQIALQAESVLSSCYPRAAKDFFRGCLDNSYLFGDREEQALMKATYGRSITAYPDIGGYQEAMKYYQMALPVLKARGLNYRCLLLYTSMGFNYYMQGKYKKAINVTEKGLNLEVNDRSENEVLRAKVTCASILAYNLSFEGQIARAESLLLESMKSLGDSEHPTMSVMLNSMGLLAERNGNQVEKALNWYMASLSRRRKVSSINREKLVISLCNVAKLLSRNKGKHVAALRLLMEAKAIREEYGWIHQNSALIQRYIYDVYKRQGKVKESIAYAEDALSIYTSINPDYFGITELVADLAHSYILIKQPKTALSCFQKIYDMKHTLLEDHSSECYLSGALEHIVRLNIDILHIQKFYTEELLAELRRLAQLPEIRRSVKAKYLRHVGSYSYSLLLMENKIGMAEDHAGIPLESLPGTCYYCAKFMKLSECTQQEYINVINGLYVSDPLA